MAQQSIHHAEPSPYIHSNVRRYVAPEMQDKRIKPVGYTKPAGKRVSVHELSRILREKIIVLLSDGEKWSVAVERRVRKMGYPEKLVGLRF